MGNDFQLHKIKYPLIGIFIILVACLAWICGLDELLINGEAGLYDFRAKLAIDNGPFKPKFPKASKDIVLLEVDDTTFQKINAHEELKLGRWPWPRWIWGDVLDFVNKGHPKAVIFDFTFAGADETSQVSSDSDKYFADALKKYKNTVIGVSLTPNYEENKAESFQTLKAKSIVADTMRFNGLNIPSLQLYESYSAPSDEFLQNTGAIGIVNVVSNGNDAIRYHYPIFQLNKGVTYLPSLPLAAVLSVLPENEKHPFQLMKDKIILGKRVIPLDEEGRFLINWHGTGSNAIDQNKTGKINSTYAVESAYKVIFASALSKGIIRDVNTYDLSSPEVFKDKIVIVGQTSVGSDLHPTSMKREYPGPEINATLIDNILNDTDITNPARRPIIVKVSTFVNVTILLIFCIFTCVNILRTRKNFSNLILWYLLSITGFILLALIAFVYYRYWINMIYPIIFISATAGLTYLYRIHTENLENELIKSQKRKIEDLFGKFVSPQVLNTLLDDPSSISKKGQRKNMTVFFSDIRGFTTLSETTQPEDLITQLNEYMAEMVEIILTYNGTFDKFIGDAIMAFWGDPLPMEDHAQRAIMAALDMLDKLQQLNVKWEEEGKPELNIGIGINSGDMVVGYMGSSKIVDYTVIGDNVNLASRLEGVNKDYETNIIISESTYEVVKDVICATCHGDIKVKGKNKPVKIYSVTRP